MLFWPIFEKLKIEKFRFGIWSIFGEKPQNRTLKKNIEHFHVLQFWNVGFCNSSRKILRMSVSVKFGVKISENELWGEKME